jgi:hypothetical protein
MIGDITFLDDRGRAIARLTGYEAIMDPLLSRAFGLHAAAAENN